jgi:hypothetical protein
MIRSASAVPSVHNLDEAIFFNALRKSCATPYRASQKLCTLIATNVHNLSANVEE